uniref:Secreted protein n=1 Tax=Amblyomma tuberculatum TaxID=48802 RepID=A0A6M2E159_9ACAR
MCKFFLVCSFANPIGLLLTGDGAPVFVDPVRGVCAECQTAFVFFFQRRCFCRMPFSRSASPLAGLAPKVCEPEFCAHSCKKESLITFFPSEFVHFPLISPLPL